jgi:phage/plasmid primase-like uncharacterized protein
MTPKEQAEQQFSEWLSQFGDAQIPADGEWYNFALNDGSSGKKGSAKLTFGDNRIEGVFKDFRAEKDFRVWHPGNGASVDFTDEERQAWTAQIEQKAAEKKAAQEAALKKALALYKKSKAATTEHPYLLKKGITEIGPLKISGKDLLIPIYNARTDQFQSIQRILPDGAKLFLEDGIMAGGYVVIGGRELPKGKHDGKFIICEGYATGYAIAAAISARYYVICALNCGNVITVAKILHERFPLRDVIIAADNDTETAEKLGYNPGIRDATKAALAIGRKIAVPPPGDFWDLWHSEGDAAVKKLIDEAVEPLAEPKPEVKEPDAGALIISSRELVTSFVAPDYLIDGLIQRRFLYSCTALTHAGKTNVTLRLAAHVAFGLPLGDREIEQGKVLFFAGENPDDVTMRWIKLCEEMKIDDQTDQVFWRKGSLSINKMRQRINAETKKHGPFALIIIDTAAAYFEGTEENSNTEYGNFARMLRTLVNIYGGPTILVNCHPIKNATLDNLIPRGGGAFLNEVDGNLVLKTISEAPKVVDLHWQGKFRGPEFAPIPFMIIPGFSERIKDSKGRQISTVYAKPLTAAERATAEDQGQMNQDKLLKAMKARDGASLSELAEFCGWYYKTGEPNKSLAQRSMEDLEARSLVKKEHGRWTLTKTGWAAANEILPM